MKRQPLDISRIPLRGSHLIEASAGTGKTFTITSLIVRLLVEEKLGIEQIVAVTFTNAATAELRDRVRRRISEARRAVKEGTAADDPLFEHLRQLPEPELVAARLEVAERNADRAGIFTIHGFAQRMLRDHAFESGVREDLELTGDDKGLIYDVVTDFWSTEVSVLSPDLFRALGGAQLFDRLAGVAAAVAGAHEVPLVTQCADAQFDALAEQVAPLFEAAARQFAQQGQELFELLSSHCHMLHANTYSQPKLAADQLELARFLFQRDSLQPPEQSLDRWTARRVLAKTKKAYQGDPIRHPLLGTLQELSDALGALQEAAQLEEDRLRTKLAQQVSRRVHQERERAGVQSFDGLLTDLCAALREPGSGERLAAALRRKYPVALIDEFQDTDPVQYEIFSRIYQRQGASGGLFLIGDPKQSIYAFRGADVHTYLRASKAVAAVWTLSTSYRSSPRVIEALNAVFSGPEQPFDLPDIRYEQVSPRPGAISRLMDDEGKLAAGLTLLWSERRQSEWIEVTADAVAQMVHSGARLKAPDGQQEGEQAIGPSNIAVLTRSNREAQAIQTLLIERGVPAVMHGDRSVFEAPEALELRRVLLALDQPGQRRLVRTALATRMLGLDAQQLADLEQDVSQLEAWAERLRRWGTTLRQHGVARALNEMWAAVELTPRTLRELDGERRITNFRHLLELLHEEQTRSHLGVPGLLRFLETAISAPTGHTSASESMQVRLESDSDAVTLTTAHKSKGLEYDIVFLPRVAAPERRLGSRPYRFYDPEQDSARLEIRGSETRKETEDLASREAHQEALRLGYVALTRAKHHVVAVTGPKSRGFSALGYFLHARGVPGHGFDDAPAGPLELDRHLRSLPVEARRSDLMTLASRSDGAIRFAEAVADPTCSRAATRQPRELQPPRALPRLIETERTSSFSAMTRERAGAGLSRAAREGHDIDETGLSPEAGPSLEETGPSLEDKELSSEAGLSPDEAGLPGESAPLSDSAAADDLCLLADFPRGATAGDGLHAALEHAPLHAEREARDEVAREQLARRGFSAEHQARFAEALEHIVSCPFGPAGLTLANLPPERRSAEMEFSLPVGELGAGGRRFSPARLAGALSEQRPPWLREPYVERVAKLGFAAFSGFLRGFIDLVFEHEGKLYVVDYKSNHLGEHYSDYRRQALLLRMEEHHYLLQGLVYSLAIHRYAATRRSDYDVQKHFGGIYYLFLRGMRPESRDDGVFFFRPDAGMMQRLQDALAAKSARSEEVA